jgi:hypothetical protein
MARIVGEKNAEKNQPEFQPFDIAMRMLQGA